MTINFTSLFTDIGSFANAGNTLQTAAETTVETEVEDAVQELGGSNAIDFEAVRQNILDSLRAWQESASAAMFGAVANPVRTLVVETVKADNQQPSDGLEDALEELIRQMKSNSETLDASTPSTSISYDSDNVGNGRLVVSVRRPDGLVNEHILPEDIECTIDSADLTGLATLDLLGEPETDVLSYDWPKGSGVGTNLTSLTSGDGDNQVSNGGFEEEDDNSSDTPEDWIASVATLGTTLKLTDVEVQTVTLSGSPTSGHYLLHWVDENGNSQTTAPLAHDASQSDVQTALRSLVGLEEITVSTSGSSPNFTHTITFTGVPGPAELTSTDNLDTGSIAHATSTAGSENVMRGARAVELDSDGAELTTLNQRLTLTAKSQYAVNAWFLADVSPAAGVITIDLVDGIGGSVIQDDEGFQNTAQFAASTLTTSFQSFDALLSETNEVQQVSISGSPTGGNFTLTYDGQTTANIAFDANAAAVQSALEALSNIGTGNVSASGGSLPGTPVDVTFQNDLGGRNVVDMTADGSGLTGGSTPDASVAVTTEGVPAIPVFRTPTNLPSTVYLRVRISTAVSSGTSVFLDEVVFAEMSELYPGGPHAALFSGPNIWEVDDAITLTMANDRAGELHEWMERICSLRELGLLIPTTTSTNETQSDALVT